MTSLRTTALAAVLAIGVTSCDRGPGSAAVADLKIITHGHRVDLAEHLAPGKHTVVDFYAAWCPPCRVVGPALERLAAAESARLAVRKVDIVDWTMPVVEQYAIESLPYLMLFDASGRRVAEGDAVYPALAGLFGAAAKEVVAAGSAVSAEPAPGEPAVDEAGRSVL